MVGSENDRDSSALDMDCGTVKESKSNVEGECSGDDLVGEGNSTDFKGEWDGDNGVAEGGEPWFFLVVSDFCFRFLLILGAEFKTFNMASINNPLSWMLAKIRKNVIIKKHIN